MPVDSRLSWWRLPPQRRSPPASRMPRNRPQPTPVSPARRHPRVRRRFAAVGRRSSARTPNRRALLPRGRLPWSLGTSGEGRSSRRGREGPRVGQDRRDRDRRRPGGRAAAPFAALRRRRRMGTSAVPCACPTAPPPSGSARVRRARSGHSDSPTRIRMRPSSTAASSCAGRTVPRSRSGSTGRGARYSSPSGSARAIGRAQQQVPSRPLPTQTEGVRSGLPPVPSPARLEAVFVPPSLLSIRRTAGRGDSHYPIYAPCREELS